MLKKLHQTKEATTSFFDMWGPVPPDRYKTNYLAFLVQAPRKAFAFWEKAPSGFKEFGLVLEEASSGQRQLLARGLDAVSDYWIDVRPDSSYAVELVGWDDSGLMKVLMRSRIIRTPRDWMSSNTNAIFIDVRDRRRFKMKWGGLGDAWKRLKMGASERLSEINAFGQNILPLIPSSVEKVPSSWGKVASSWGKKEKS